MPTNKSYKTWRCPLKHSFISAVLFSQLFTACVNTISEDLPIPGDVPITLSAMQKGMSGSATNGFEENDAIGLYIMVEPNSINDTRYIDNMKFTNSASGSFSPQEIIFFPEGNVKSSFISYYPYRKNAVAKGKSKINVETKADQSADAAFAISDFMLATTNEVTASAESIDLLFAHKFFKLNIQLEALNGYTAETLLAANPTVTIKNVSTKANYDLNAGVFTEHSTKADITPHGTWSIEDGKLVGKSAIILPQTLAQSHTLLEIEVDGKVFESKTTEERTLPSGVAEDNTISFISTGDEAKISIKTNVSEWTSQQNDMTAIEAGTVIHTSQLDFTASNVLKVMNKGAQVAEICLEYLVADGVEKQAIVVYPIRDGETDLTQGIVAELKEGVGNKHGGSVAWNKTDNTLMYTEGTSAPIQYIYIDNDGRIQTTRPTQALALQVRANLFTDSRENESFDYAIVKIGTQYWLRANLKATNYTDGVAINHGGNTDQRPTVHTTEAKYYDRSNAYFFYNAACATTTKLSPEGCRIANEADFTRLKTYIKDNASVLKKGITWSGKEAANNLSGFNAVATGYFNKTYTGSNAYAAYWCPAADNPTAMNKIVKLNNADNKISFENATKDMAATVRCLLN